MSKSYAAVTICARNYLSRALVLRSSYLAHHPGHEFFILITERKDEAVAAAHPGVSLLWGEELGIPAYLNAAMKFDVIELSTNVKAVALRRLLERFDAVLYIDPDIFVYRPLEPVFRALETHAIAVTPHTLTPVLDGMNPADDDFSRFGAFNLGFLAVARSESAAAFLDWWADRCLRLGFYEPQIGLAVDQKWVDLAPAYFQGVCVLRDRGLNVAFWNLHERVLGQVEGQWFVNGTEPLYFMHFSSFSTDDPHAIAHKQTRFAPGTRPDLHALLDGYAELLRREEGALGRHQPSYAFDHFSDGAYITPTLRRVFASLESEFPVDEDPFQAGSTAHRWAMDCRLALKDFTPGKRIIFKDRSRYSRAEKVLTVLLRLALRILGPNRYFLLMKYLAQVSSIRNQRGLVPPPTR
jgi:hypothetical protein